MINKSLQITALLSSCFMLFAGGCAQESGEVKSAAQTPETSQIAAAEAPAVVDSQTMELLEADVQILIRSTCIIGGLVYQLRNAR